MNGTVSPPFKLQLSELTAFQFQFLVRNGYKAEFFRSLNCFRSTVLSREVKKEALAFLLTFEDMLLTLIATDPFSYIIIYNSTIRHGNQNGRGNHWAAIRGYDRLMEQILSSKNCEVGVVGSGGMNALHFASKYGKSNVTKMLLKDGRLDPDLKTTTGFSNAYFAIKCNHPECLKHLLADPRSDPNTAVCPDGYRAIDNACIGGHTKSLEVILGLEYWRINPSTARVGTDKNPFP
jgi:Ankyrin repeats (3 copies)